MLVQTQVPPGIGSVHCVTHLFDSTSFKIVRWVECSPFQPGRANTIECGRNSQVRPLAPEFQLKYILYLYLSSPQQVISAYRALKGKFFITMNMKKMHLLATSRRADINHLRLCCIFNATECFCLHKLCLYLCKFSKEKLIKRNLEKKKGNQSNITLKLT